MKFLQKSIPAIFVMIFSYILVLLFIFDRIEFYNQRNFLLRNAFALVFIGIVFAAFCFYNHKCELSDKKYFKIILIMSFVVLTIQLLMNGFASFRNNWDANTISSSADFFIRGKGILEPIYMTRYPNNMMLTFILILIRSIPIVGKYKFILNIVNSIIVTLAGIVTSLTIRRLTNNRLALLIYIIMIPLVLLSPWVLIVYSDTFALLFPISILYIYTKKNKTCYDYFFIVFLSFFGTYIKPTIIISLIAIIIVEVFTNFKRGLELKNVRLNRLSKYFLIIITAVLVPYFTNVAASVYYDFHPVKGEYEFTLVHYLAMGQNDETQGVYSHLDVRESIENGMKPNFNKFKKRILGRSFFGNVHFFSQKTLINYNDGSFAWDKEGGFYVNVKETKNKVTQFFRAYIYESGAYHNYYLLFLQWIWLLVVVFVPFIVRKKNNKEELTIMLMIIGITLFLTIFESRARYLYCYSPIYLVCFVLGIKHAKMLLESKFLKMVK